jgi:hypothetical protein
MSDITIGVILGFVMLYLLQWAGKHFLDRLVLPRVLDWWAKQSKQMALQRAQYLCQQFELDLKLYSNINLVVLRIEERRNKHLLFPGAIVLLLVYIIFIRQNYPEVQAPPTQVAIMLLVTILLVSISIFFIMTYENRRDYRALADFTHYRDRTILRLEKLFQAAGLDDDEIRARLERVPVAPLSTP